MYLIADDLAMTYDEWVAAWAWAGIRQIESLLAKHAAFLDYLKEHDDR